MRSGVRIGLDFGSKRIGVARCDRDGLISLPLAVLEADGDWCSQLEVLVRESEPLEFVVGLPVSLRGRAELAVDSVHEQVRHLQAAFPQIPVRGVDERLSSATANRQLKEAGYSTRDARQLVDALAAAGILDFALDIERRTGSPAGELL